MRLIKGKGQIGALTYQIYKSQIYRIIFLTALYMGALCSISLIMFFIIKHLSEVAEYTQDDIKYFSILYGVMLLA